MSAGSRNFQSTFDILLTAEIGSGGFLFNKIDFDLNKV